MNQKKAKAARRLANVMHEWSGETLYPLNNATRYRVGTFDSGIVVWKQLPYDPATTGYEPLRISPNCVRHHYKRIKREWKGVK